MSPGGTTDLGFMSSLSAVPPGRMRGVRGLQFPAMNHWAALRGPSGARHLQNALSDYFLNLH
jgi:hypothetical protein